MTIGLMTLVRIVVGCLILFNCGIVGAQNSLHYLGPSTYAGATLEWQVMDADVIVRAVPIEIDDHVPPTDHLSYRRVVFEVKEVLKGNAPAQIEVMCPPGPDTHLEWRVRSGKPEIFFFQHSKRIVEQEGLDRRRVVKKYPLCLARFFLLDISVKGFSTRGAYTMDLRVLQEETDLERELRAAIESQAKTLEPLDDSNLPTQQPGFGVANVDGRTSFTMEIPINSHPYTNSITWRGNAQTHALTFPFDERLAEIARRRFAIDPDDPFALEVFRSFKNEHTVEALKSQLDDSKIASGYDMAPGLHNHWTLALRERAYGMLQHLGVTVDRPRINMPNDAYVGMTRLRIVLAIGFALFSTIGASYLFRRMRRRFELPHGTRAFAFDAAIALIIGVLLLQTFFFVDQ